MLKIVKEEYDRIVAHAVNGLPNEACGLAAGTQEGEDRIIRKAYCLSNTDNSPEHFSMDPKEQFKVIADIRANGFTLLGNFHSHPATPARPSQEDIRLAFDPRLIYIIVSLKDGTPVLKSFSIRQGASCEEFYVVLENETAAI